MIDRLHGLLEHFELRARLFQAGALCHASSFDADDRLGYIHVMRSGSMIIETDAQATHLVEDPCLLFYMNSTSHRLIPQSDGAETFCASFEFGTGLQHPLRQALPNLILVKLADMPMLNLSLNLLFQEATEQGCGQQAILDRMMEIIIVQLLRNLMNQKRLQSGLLAGLAEPRLAKAIQAIHTQPGHAWSVETLATVAGMSRARFAASFSTIVGLTPGGYLSEWRIGIAQTLLRRGKPLQSIASAVGYGSASALSRAFSAQLGLSPKEWLKRDCASA